MTGPLLILGAVVGLDQASKAVVEDWIGPGSAQHRWELLASLVALEYVENTGGAFGLLRGGSGVLVPLALIVVTVIVVIYVRTQLPDSWTTISVALLVGGAIGNLIDRLRLGFVIDFVAVGAWPRFNVADTAITIGIGLGAWRMLAGPASVAGTNGGEGGGYPPLQ